MNFVAAFVLFVIAAHLLVSAIDRPRRPIPPDVDRVYVLVPGLFAAVLALGFAMVGSGYTWHELGEFVSEIISHMFEIV